MRKKISPAFIVISAFILAILLCLLGLQWLVVIFSAVVILGTPFYYYWWLSKKPKGVK